jgi:hypothetical protein
MRDKLLMKYQWPDDVEAFMDAFAAANPNAGWREFQRAFEQAMLQSMRPGGELYERFEASYDRGKQ